MFVQVIQGQVGDAGKVRAAMDRWAAELAPGADGWLGSTAGVTEDGRFIGLARFESEEAARRNSERPEQGRWWAETEKLFEGGATFRESTDVVVDVNGDPDKAGFVQVMQGRTSDPARARELMAQDPDTLPVEMEPTGALPSRPAAHATEPALEPDLPLSEPIGEALHTSPPPPPASGS